MTRTNKNALVALVCSLLILVATSSSPIPSASQLTGCCLCLG